MTLLQRLVELKDNLLFSNKVYTTIRKAVCSHWPSLYFFNKAKEKLNDGLFRIYRNSFGHYVDCGEKIVHYIKKNFKDLDIKNKIKRVKLFGDGTITGPLTHLNFGFALPDLGDISKTAAGNFQLGIFEIKNESYPILKECLAEVANNLNKFAKEKNKIIIDNEEYTIKFIMGGDLKWLHAIMGLNACNSSHPCLWCKFHKDNFSKLSGECLNDVKDLKRNIKEPLNNFKNQKGFLEEPKEFLGYQNTPIFDFIDFEDCVFDTLHMLLRIVEKLMNLFFAEFESIDDDKSKNLNDLPYQKRFFDSLLNIGIYNPFYMENNCFKMKSFNGDECMLILEKLNFEAFFPTDLFPLFKKKDIFDSLLRDFHEIFSNVKKNFYLEKTEILQVQTDAWLKSYISTFHLKHVTPYMHIFCHHLCLFIEQNGDVDQYHCQGVEKTNHFLKSEYFGTNRNYSQKSYSYQMISYRNRVESYKRVKFVPKYKKNPANLKRSLIRKNINRQEFKRDWIQFKIGNSLIKSCETDTKFSVKVLISLMNLIKNNDTLILDDKILLSIKNKNMPINELNYLHSPTMYTKIAGILEEKEDLYLFYTDLQKQIFFMINPLQKKNTFQEVFIENFLNNAKICLGIKDKFKNGVFKFTTKKISHKVTFQFYYALKISRKKNSVAK